MNNSKSGKFQYVLYQRGVWKYKHLLALKTPQLNYLSIVDFIKIQQPCTLYVDHEQLKERFPVLSKKGLLLKNF